jgi:hypothetical protein
LVVTDTLAEEYAEALRIVGRESGEAYWLVADGFRRGSLTLKAKILSTAPEVLAAEATIHRVGALMAHEREEVDEQTRRILKSNSLYAMGK